MLFGRFKENEERPKDIVFHPKDKFVSKLHAEIFFDRDLEFFFLKNYGQNRTRLKLLTNLGYTLFEDMIFYVGDEDFFQVVNLKNMRKNRSESQFHQK